MSEYESTHPLCPDTALTLTLQEANEYNTGAIGRISLFPAEVAQLVEHLLAKEKVAGSNPVFRSSSLVERAIDGPFCVSMVSCCGILIQPCGRGGMADAAVLNIAGATRAGSNPAVRTPQKSA